MRLPLSKVYRAFPELDRFSDEQCEKWQRLANQLWPWKRLAVSLAIVAVFAIVYFVTTAAFGFVAAATAFNGQRGTDIGNIVLVLILVGPLLIAVLASLGIRDWWTRFCLRRFIDDRLCGCGYSLLGLPEEPQDKGVVVHCPECGTQHRLDTRTGLTTPGVSA